MNAAAPGSAAVLDGAPGRPAVYTLRGVGRVYRTGEVDVHALLNVDLDVWDRELVVLLGGHVGVHSLHGQGIDKAQEVAGDHLVELQPETFGIDYAQPQ